jgi:hypothetical protein
MGNDDYSPTKRMTGGTIPALIWRKVMAYAHQGIMLRPLPGLPPPQHTPALADAAFAQEPAAKQILLTRKGTETLLHVEHVLDEASHATRVPLSQIAQATGSEAPPLILEANVDAQFDNPMTAVTQAPSVAAVAPNVKDQSPNTISKTLLHEAARLKDDATGWAHKWQELGLDLKLQLESQEKPKWRDHGQRHQRMYRRATSGGQPVGAGCGSRGHLAQTGGRRSWTCDPRGGAYQGPESCAGSHPVHDIRKNADYFQQEATELHALNRSIEEIRTRLVTQIDRLEELKIQLEFNRTVAQIGEAVKSGKVSIDNIQVITADAQRIAADFAGFGRTSAVVTEPNEVTKPAEAAKRVKVAKPVEVKKRIPGTLMNGPRSRFAAWFGHR